MPRKLKALILGSPDPVSMGLARGWMMAGHEISALWYAERQVGSVTFNRDQQLAATAPGVSMHALAARYGFSASPVAPLVNWASQAAEKAKALAVDVVLSLMFMDRIPQEMIVEFPQRIFNLHPSLLPAYRGPASVLNMLWDQTIEKHGGMTAHLVDAGFDSGAIIGHVAVPFSAHIPVASYFMQLVKAGSPLLANSIAGFLEGSLTAKIQDDANLLAESKLRPGHIAITAALSSGHIDWICRTVAQLTDVRIEGFDPNYAVSHVIGKGDGTQHLPQAVSRNTLRFKASDGDILIALKPIRN